MKYKMNHLVTQMIIGCVYHLSQVRNTFQYPLSKRICKRLPPVVAFIIKLYREYESRGGLVTGQLHCAV